MNSHRLFAVAAWHADKAIAAYLSGEFDIYTRHISICDDLRRRAYALKRAA
ncbi:hypothetical protein [Bradyrhizobium elkanii]|jgi:hypothetical protein|uniref:hypothetical protein n=1 Tax=Bradyrhizobium elkanii TaxID=29448 RepID=UPI0014494337|nr:hypothetical protein [Bradyrhizobium elkanii]MCP1932549.1 hypothetical protein [Bradyrhizobium elkanii]MCS3479524.1 hypothetical protein [Bradyrhizobium elkanii]MCS3576909.1 hypothetical protein [Bradyrhizobium elkanii]MCS3719786.1 hypothetical protein [Bradyrhizobium elkanii]MCS4004203.1 hypothetical protein [Bradyrhizobium elkanii USDA 61]